MEPQIRPVRNKGICPSCCIHIAATMGATSRVLLLIALQCYCCWLGCSGLAPAAHWQHGRNLLTSNSLTPRGHFTKVTNSIYVYITFYLSLNYLYWGYLCFYHILSVALTTSTGGICVYITFYLSL